MKHKNINGQNECITDSGIHSGNEYGRKNEDSPLFIKRRHFLIRAAELEVMIIASSLSIHSITRAFVYEGNRHPTPSNEPGPFCKRGTLHRKVLRANGDPGFPDIRRG